MGYNTTFSGEFSLNKFLQPEHKAYLRRFAEIRHEAMDEETLKRYPDPLREAVGLPVGKYGMYFTGLIDPDGVGDDLLNGSSLYLDKTNIMRTLEVRAEGADWAPSTYCQWVPTYEGRGITDEGEKFYSYVAWLRFLIEHFLRPRGYELSGEVPYQGEQGEHGKIIVEHNEVSRTIEGDSLLPRSKESPIMEEVIKTYWMAAGSISDAARQAILAIGGIVRDVHEDPPIVLIGIPYDINYYKRHGHDDLAIMTTEGIALYSKNLRLAYSSNKFPGNPWRGLPLDRLILPDEPWEDRSEIYEDYL